MTKLDTAKRAQIAERLKEARKLAGLSQGHVAGMLGLHRPSRHRDGGGQTPRLGPTNSPDLPRYMM